MNSFLHLQGINVDVRPRAVHLFLFLLLLSLSGVYAEDQEPSSSNLPFQLSALIQDMKDDNQPGNATRAYETLRTAKNSLTEEQKEVVVNRLSNVLKREDHQQAILAAALLRRWSAHDVLFDGLTELLPKIIRTLTSDPGKTIKYACENLLLEIQQKGGLDHPRISYSVPKVNQLLDQVPWRGNRETRKKLSIKFANLLGSDCTSETVLEGLIDNLESDSIDQNANRAVDLLMQMDPALVKTKVQRALESDDRQKRQFSAMVLRRLESNSPDKPYIKTLVSGLKDDDINHNASRSLEELKEIGSSAHPFLEKALSSDDRQQSQLAAWLLLNDPSYDMTEALLQACVNGLRDDELQGMRGEPFANRHWSYRALLDSGERAIPFLLQGLASDDWQQELYSARALLSIGHPPSRSRAIPVFMKQFKHDEIPGNGKNTEWFLERLKKNKRTVFRDVKPVLKRLLSEGTPQQCAAALHLLNPSALPDPPTEPILDNIRAYLDHSEPQQEWQIAAAKYGGNHVETALERKIERLTKDLIREATHPHRSYSYELLKLKPFLLALNRHGDYHSILSFLLEKEKSRGTNDLDFLRSELSEPRGEVNVRKWIDRTFTAGEPDLSDDRKQQLQNLVQQLGARNLSRRKKATRTLMNSPHSIAPFLNTMFPHQNPEINNRLSRVLMNLTLKKKKEKLQTLWENAQKNQR